LFLISFASAAVTTTLNSPADDSTVYNNLVTFNATASVTDGATLTNMSLWTNESGSWETRNSTNISTINGILYENSTTKLNIMDEYILVDSVEFDKYFVINITDQLRSSDTGGGGNHRKVIFYYNDTTTWTSTTDWIPVNSSYMNYSITNLYPAKEVSKINFYLQSGSYGIGVYQKI